MKAIRLSTTLATRWMPSRGLAAAAPKPEAYGEYDDPEPESSTAAQRRLLSRNPPSPSPSPDEGKPRRRRGASALAMIRAQRLAEALKDSPPPSNSTIPLSSTIPPSTTPTLEDLEEKRPKRPPPPLNHPRYPRQYHKIYSDLDGAFTAKQLYKLAPKVGVRIPKGKSKTLAIRGILGTWGWVQPLSHAQKEERAKREAEMVDRDWELTKSELWLLMRDTASLRPALERGVRFSIPEGQRGEDGMRVLRATGGEESLAELDNLINEKRKAIELHTRVVDHSSSLSEGSGITSAIANVSGAHLAVVENEQVRISASTTESLDKASLLLAQSAQHSIARTSIPKAILTPSLETELGLYPHLPAPTGSIPWRDLGAASRSLFRLRRVQPWETKVGPRETVHIDEKLDDLSLARVGEETQAGGSVVQRISDVVGSSEGRTTTIKFGHVVHPNNRSDGSSLIPPAHATCRLSGAASSQVVAGSSTFLPSLPPSLIHFPLDQKPVIRRELRYRNDDGRVLQLSYDVPAPQATADIAAEPKGGWHKELDEYMDRLNLDEASASQEVEGRLHARLESGKAMEILMPDRPIDFTVTSSTSGVDIDAELISTILPYIQNPTGLPPSSIKHDNGDWHLLSTLELETVQSDITQTSDIGVDIDLPSTPIILRTVRATDLTFGSDRSIRYAELETEGEMSPSFWAELARVTRVLAPGAGALRAEIY